MSDVRPYGKVDILDLDGRSRAARFIREVRDELTAHCGGKPSATQRALIETVAYMRLRITTLDRKFSESGQTEHDGRSYLALANSHARLLTKLGMKGVPAPRVSLAEQLRAGPKWDATSSGTPEPK
jgi:hypothetical protein